MTPARFDILGVPFDATSLAAVLKDLEAATKGRQQLFIVTPNPEICLLANKKPSYRKLLGSAQLSLPDGFGILWAARFLNGHPSFLRWLWTLATPWLTRKHSPLPHRVTGSDMVRRFFREQKETPVFLLGASEAVNASLSEQLKKKGVQVVGNYSGHPGKKLEPIIRSMIDASGAKVLFVAFGAPQQEEWIDRNLPLLKSVRVAAGIGGAFDFLVGKRRRAPRWMQQFGLEWLFRLLIEPRRIGRILNATVVFPWRVFISSKSTYN